MLQKRGKTYHTRIMFRGRLYQRSLHTKNKEEARNMESIFRSALVQGNFDVIDDVQNPTLEKFRKRLFAHLKSTVHPNTYVWYEDRYNVLCSFDPLRTSKLNRIDTSLIEQYIQHCLNRKEPVGLTNINQSLRTLRRALHKAEDWKLIRRAPRIHLLPGENSREYVISEDTLKLMVDWIEKAYPTSVMHLLLPFLVDTGLRITEACNLTRETISMEPKPGAERGWLHVVKGKTKYAKRYVPLTDRAATMLQEVLKRSKSEWVWTAKGGRKPMTRYYPTHQFKLIADALNLPDDCVLHSTRHTFCTRLGESGADAFTIQRLAGHSSITVSQKYVHPTPTVIESAISRMQAVRDSRIANKPEPSDNEQTV
jgi:site-specific recombinase XerD